VERYTSIRALILIVAEMGQKIHQMDMTMTLLNFIIEEEVYIEKPKGFNVHGMDSHVCRLRRALYGIKKAPKVWYSQIENYL